MASPNEEDEGSCRIRSYKNKGLDLEEGRRRRHAENIQLRKSRRDEQVAEVVAIALIQS